jgi:hypothetical protein
MSRDSGSILLAIHGRTQLPTRWYTRIWSLIPKNICTTCTHSIQGPCWPVPTGNPEILSEPRIAEALVSQISDRAKA